MTKNLKRAETVTAVTVLPARGQSLKEKEAVRHRAKALAAIKQVEKVRFVKRLAGEDCSVPVVSLADLERRDVERRKPKLISLFDLLVWTYQAQKADEAEWRGRHGGFISSRTVTARVCDILAMGTIVDGGAGSFDIPADACAVHNAVMGLADVAREQVIECAVAGMGPAWRSYAPEARVQPVLRGNGKVRMLWDASRNAIGCRVMCSGAGLFERERLDEQARLIYGRWISSLQTVEQALPTGGLKKHKLCGLGVTEQPWATERVFSLQPA